MEKYYINVKCKGNSRHLYDAHTNNHMNALISRIIINNLWSNTSPFYTQYRKFMDKGDDITPEMEDEYGEL